MEEAGRGRWKKFTAEAGRSSPRWVEEVERGTHQVARRMRMSPSQFCQYLNGKIFIDVPTLAMLSKILNCPEESLVKQQNKEDDHGPNVQG